MSRGQSAGSERKRRLDKFIQRIDQNDAVFPTHGGEDVIVGRQRACVALRRRLPARGAAEFQHQDGLAGIERAFGRCHQGIRPAHTLRHAGDHLRMNVVDQKIDVIGHVEVEFVAAGYRIGIAEPARGPLFEPILVCPARLKDHAHRSGRQVAHPGRRIE